MEFSPLKAEVDEMTVLTTQSAQAPLLRTPLFKASSMPEIPAASVSMDHLDALEAQSIYILREAFARLRSSRCCGRSARTPTS